MSVRADAVADAILYEGYMLYPYRRSALKDRQPTLFGTLRPRDETSAPEQWKLGCECLVSTGVAPRLEGALRCLIPSAASASKALEVQIPRTELATLAERSLLLPFHAATSVGPVEGDLVVGAADVAQGVLRLSIEVANRSPLMPGSTGPRMLSTQVLLQLEGAAFVPPREPPPALAAASAACRSSGLWPILLGEPRDRDLLLCSPIIVDDHPAVAPESREDLFDATEIDELLTLRIRTLSDDERREIGRGDERIRSLVERADGAGPEELLRLHATMRPSAFAPVPSSEATTDVAPGVGVRLRPRRRADILDVALAGRLATVASVETDLEGRRYVVVTIDDDPGRDLGDLGKPGHRFFFDLDEVEPVGGT